MRARCTRFAAAWVVVGCSASPPRVAPAPESPADAGAIAVATPPPDAAPPIDAAPADAFINPCLGPMTPQRTANCNPPAPGHVVGTIIDVEQKGSEMILVISVGSDDGVGRDWTGSVVDDHDLPVRGGQLVVIQVHSRTCIVKTKLTRDQVMASGLRARLDPP